MRRSRLLTAAEFERMRASAEILEQDAKGLKVLRLENGDILKLFRVKHLISSARLYSHARSFCRNADRFKGLGVPTVTIKQLFHFSDSNRSAVLYQPLPGCTVRQIAHSEGLNEQLLQHMGVFVAGLHRHGIYFRSLHFGNIVQTPVGELGLIDIADLSIRPWRLSCHERLRNFRHLCRLADDRQWFGQDGWRVFCAAYIKASGLTGSDARQFAIRAEDMFGAG